MKCLFFWLFLLMYFFVILLMIVILFLLLLVIFFLFFFVSIMLMCGSGFFNGIKLLVLIFDVVIMCVKICLVVLVRVNVLISFGWLILCWLIYVWRLEVCRVFLLKIRCLMWRGVWLDDFLLVFVNSWNVDGVREMILRWFVNINLWNFWGFIVVELGIMIRYLLDSKVFYIFYIEKLNEREWKFDYVWFLLICSFCFIVENMLVMCWCLMIIFFGLLVVFEEYIK